MKITVQNGSTHVLSRKDMESILPAIPSELVKGIKSIILCTDSTDTHVDFHNKEKIVAFYSNSNKPVLSDKISALQELTIALFYIQERNYVPGKITNNQRSKIIDMYSSLYLKFKEVLNGKNT